MSDEADRRARIGERLEREATRTEHSAKVPGRTTLVEQHYGARAPLNTGVPGKTTLVDQHVPGIDVQSLLTQARQALAGSGDRDSAYKAVVDALASHASTLAPEQTAELMDACVSLLQSRRSPTAVASRGVADAASTLPFYDEIQASFGRHDVSSVRAQVGGEAAGAAAELGAHAYATGDRIGFASTPDLHTAAHEAAHVIQQRGGVQLKAIDGGASDTHEQHADAVADAVVAGQSAEALLDPFAGKGGGATVQRKTDPSTGGAALKPNTWEYCNTHRVHVVAAIADRIRSVGLPKPHPRLYWALRETAEQAFIDVLRKDVELFQAKTLHRLMELSYPADLYTLVDGVRQGGTPAQLSEWHAVVGVAIANAMSEPLDASIQRMAMRLRVQLDGPAHGDVQKAHLVPSCPLDVLVAEAFTQPGVIGGAERKAIVDDTPGKPFARGADPVQFTYAGKRDPKLWNWIEVTSPKSASIEDVASTQLDKTKEDSVMGPEQAYRITASPPLFGIPIEVARRVPEMLDYASATDEADARAGNFGRVADVKALHDSSASDDVATKQAPPAAAHTPGLDRLLGRVEVQLAAIATRLERVKAASLITGAQQFVARRREDLSTKPKEAAKYVPAVAAQEGVLHEVSSELVDIFNALDRRNASTVPPSIADVIRAYARAAGASHLAAEATNLISDARRQKALLPLAIVDDEVRSARDAVGEHGDTSETGADEQTHVLPDMMTRAADLRLRVTRGEQVTGTEVSQANADANELATRARLTNLASTVRALHDKAVSAGIDERKAPGGWWSVSLITRMILGLIYEEEKPHSQFEGAGKLHGGWLRRLDLAKKNGAKPGHDPAAEAQAAVNYINGELSLMDSQLGSMKTFIKWCAEQIAYQELENLLASLAEQIGLMIVTGEIAGAGLAAVRGVALAGEIAEDVRGMSLLWRGTEVVVHAGLQTIANGAAGGGDINGSAFAENALGMLLTSAAMKPFKALMAGDAALEATVEKELSTLAKTGKLAKGAVAVGADAVVDLGAGVVGAGVAHAIVNNADMGIASRDAWMTQGLALTASAVVHLHTQHLHARIAKAAEATRLAKMESIATQLDALAARAEKLQAKSAAKKGITPDEAGAMLTERHEILVRESALYQQAGQGQLEKASAADIKAGSGLVEVQLQLAGLSSVVDGLSYEGTGKQIEHVLQRLGSEVKATQDRDGVWSVTAGEQTFSVKQLDFDTTHGSTAQRDSKTVTMRGGTNVTPEYGAGHPRDASRESPPKELARSEQMAFETDADGRVALTGDDQLLREAARRAKPLPGYVDVVAHADSGHFYIVRGLEEVAVTHRTVALAMEKAGLKGKKIRLLACEAGRDPMAIAQDLANKTNTEVLAPTMKAWVDEAGNVGVGGERGKQQGTFETFRPKHEPPIGERPGPMVEAEHGAERDPHAPDKDPILRSEHDHRDRVEAWNHDQLQAQIGKPLVLDPGFKDGVRISVRKSDAGYEVTAVHYGPDARALDVQRHAGIVARIERYNGLVGKVRRWHDALSGKRVGAKAYEPGSRGDRLQLEVEKLEAHIRDTNLMRSNDAMDAARAKEETQFLEDAVAEIREQLDRRGDLHEHDAAFDVNRPAEPIGYVTEKAKEVGYKLPGEPGAQVQGEKLDPKDYYYRRHGDLFELARKPGAKGPQVEVVYDSAGGFKGVRLVPEEGQAAARLVDLKYKQAKELLFSKNHSMDPYAAMLEQLQIADRSAVEQTAERLYKKLTTDGKGEATIDTWRHAVKEQYRREVERRLFDKSLSDAESYRQLRDAVDVLSNKDRALLVEGWYKARRLQGADVTDVKQQQPYTVDRTGGKNAGHKETRAADFLVTREKIHGKEIVEVKDIEGEIDKEQFGAYADALHDDHVRGTLGAERMRYVFTKVQGARASLEFLADAYQARQLHELLVIEVYMPDGSRRTATDGPEALELLHDLRAR